MSNISERIKHLRKEKGISQAELARVIGLSKIAVVGYENNRREPNSKAMAALEDFFQVSGKYLRGETDERNIFEANVHDDTLARTLRRLRLKTGMTQRDLAECTGLSYAAIRSYEAGRREPGSRAMALLEEFFEVSGAYLRGETEERRSGVTKQSSNSQHFTPSEIDLLYNLVHKEIMCAERLADIYDLSGKANEDVKGELLKLAVKINEMKGY